MSARACPQLYLESFPADASNLELSEFEIAYGLVATPLGRCLIGEARGRVCFLAFVSRDGDQAVLEDLSRRWPGVALRHDRRIAENTLDAIFRRSSPDAPIRLLVRGTPFQVEVWRALLQIPRGQTQSYAKLAKKIGRPKATRAVGSAIGANPIAWLIPCHRVIRSDGQLGGYRWGASMKKACLAYEKERQGGLNSVRPSFVSAR